MEAEKESDCATFFGRGVAFYSNDKEAVEKVAGFARSVVAEGCCGKVVTHKHSSRGGMSFGAAVEAMRLGHSVARATWRCCKRVRLHPSGDGITCPFFVVEYRNGRVMPWVPKSVAILAMDWTICKRKDCAVPDGGSETDAAAPAAPACSEQGELND